MIEFNL